MAGSFRRHKKVVWPGFRDVAPRHVVKVGRNEPCPCGSARKYKDCHEREGTPFLEKLANEADRQRRREMVAALKAQGVPWYRRLHLWWS
jgi:hypothetical protein